MTVAEEPGALGGEGLPGLAELQHWTSVIGRAQQMMLEAASAMWQQAPERAAPPAWPPVADPARLAQVGADLWGDTMKLWTRFLNPEASAEDSPERARADKDRRFRAPEWRDNPLFDLVRQSYLLIADRMLESVEAVDGLDPHQREQLRFAARNFVDAMAPSNFALTNPLVLKRTLETKGENLLVGLERMLGDLGRRQITQGDASAFEIGRNLAMTPGKVVKRTDLYELIQYSPTTERVLETPLVIFPPWINRFYILDLSPEKSFVRWAVEQGLTVFMVSWRSADETSAGVRWEDYVLHGQIDAIETIRELLAVPKVHAIGYCVAGTTLAATLALLQARERAEAVATATFFTTQVDFTQAGDLKLFVDEHQLGLIEQVSAGNGYLDGRYMAATFNLLRARDLVWNYVVNNYLLAEDYAPFDLLHWNSDVTNLPAAWHLSYLQDLYRDNKLATAGGMVIDGTPIDLSRVRTPAYVQAAREDHIAPPESVWKVTGHLAGPIRFVLAGSGHIAGVVNPPSANKYGYWVNDEPAESLEAFVAGAREQKGSWWGDWIAWLRAHGDREVPADGARIPGEGALPALDEAPGRYVRTR